MIKTKEKTADKVFLDFQKKENLTDKQIEMFQDYAEILREWNEKFNLTAITNIGGIVRQHFQDSIEIRKFVDLTKVNALADIGPGAGFPIIPLKIMFPHLKVYLIEVNNKRQKFLNFLINRFKLENIEIIDLDWRTFIRKTDLDIDYFVTRASLHEIELIRMFKPACFYKNSKLIYWASEHWQAYPKAEKYILEEKPYKLGRRNRKFVFMGLK